MPLKFKLNNFIFIYACIISIIKNVFNNQHVDSFELFKIKYGILNINLCMCIYSFYSIIYMLLMNYIYDSALLVIF